MSNILEKLKQKIQIKLPKTNKTTTSGKGKEKKDMALYQPSNITPSTFAGIGGGIVDVNDNVSISWQVNGNSAMTGFDIQILTNETTPQTVHTFSVSSLSFYGTDKDGNPVFYVYEPSGTTWASVGLSNGEEYKMIITQYWVEGGTTKSVVQNSASVFKTRAKPTVSISPSSTTLTGVTQTFTGSYSQAQGDSIAWARWILSVDGEVLDDTGVVYTPVLSYTYDGLFSGKTYSLSLTVETENGIQATATGSYPVSYTSPSTLGNLDIKCNADDSVFVGWMKSYDIPGVETTPMGDSDIITWDQVNGEQMVFTAPNQIAWQGQIKGTSSYSTTMPGFLANWDLVKMYKEIQYDNDSVSVVAKDFERNASKDPTNSKTITPSAPAASHVTQDVYTAVTSTTYSPYTSALNIAGTVKATLSFVATRPLKTSNPVSLAEPHDDGYAQRFINFLPNTVPDPLPSYTMRTVLSDARDCYWDIITITMVGRIQDYNKPFGMYVTFHYDYYEDTVNDTPTGTDCRDFALVSSDCYHVMFEDNSGTARISFASKTTSPVNITYSYKCNYVGDDAYFATITTDSPYPEVEEAIVLSTTAPGGAVATDLGGKDKYRITFYSNAPGSYSATVKLGHLVEVIGAESYRWKYLIGTTATIVVSSVIPSGNFSKIDVVVVGTDVYLYIYNDTPTTSESISYSYLKMDQHPFTNIFAWREGADALTGWVSIGGTLADKIIMQKPVGTTIAEVSLADYPSAFKAYINVLPTKISVMLWDSADTFLGILSTNLPSTYTQGDIQLVQIETYNRNVDFITVNSNLNADLSTPMWMASTEMLWLPTNANYQAGTIEGVTASTAAVYRKEGTTLFPLGTYDLSNITSLRDYAVRSNHEISYVLYYLSNGAYSAGVESQTFCKRFKQYTLTEAEQNADGTYTALKTWRFANNIEASAVGNNNSPATMANFTRYPMWQPSEQSPKSGTLSALVGRFVQGTYSGETSEQMQELYNISHSQNTFFLRDMKGNMYMVKPNGAISQKVNDKSGLLEVTVSVPWVEVGDASKAVILKF